MREGVLPAASLSKTFHSNHYLQCGVSSLHQRDLTVCVTPCRLSPAPTKLPAAPWGEGLNAGWPNGNDNQRRHHHYYNNREKVDKVLPSGFTFFVLPKIFKTSNSLNISQRQLMDIKCSFKVKVFIIKR